MDRDLCLLLVRPSSQAQWQADLMVARWSQEADLVIVASLHRSRFFLRLRASWGDGSLGRVLWCFFHYFR